MEDKQIKTLFSCDSVSLVCDGKKHFAIYQDKDLRDFHGEGPKAKEDCNCHLFEKQEREAKEQRMRTNIEGVMSLFAMVGFFYVVSLILRAVGCDIVEP